ncbi:MAG: hypothetical protein ACRBC3_19690 [Burkholderiaceae bacterium]
MSTPEVAATDSAPTALETAEQPDNESSAGSALSQPDSDNQTQSDESSEGQSDSKRGGYKQRIGKLVQSREEAKQRAAELEQKNSELEARLNAQSAPSETDQDKAPSESDFKTWDEYQDAKARYVAERATRDVLSKAEKDRLAQENERTARDAHTKRAVNFQSGVEALAAELPDVDDAMKRMQLSNPLATGNALLRSEKGPDVAYYLASHPQELATLEMQVGNDPVEAALAVGRLEGKAAAFIKSRTKSAATKQTSPIAGAGNPNALDPASATNMADYVKLRNKQRFG